MKSKIDKILKVRLSTTHDIDDNIAVYIPSLQNVRSLNTWCCHSCTSQTLSLSLFLLKSLYLKICDGIIKLYQPSSQKEKKNWKKRQIFWGNYIFVSKDKNERMWAIQEWHHRLLHNWLFRMKLSLSFSISLKISCECGD